MVLIQVGHPDPARQRTLAGVGRLPGEQQAQQRGLPRPVGAQEGDAVAPEDAEADPLENCSAGVGLAQLFTFGHQLWRTLCPDLQAPAALGGQGVRGLDAPGAGLEPGPLPRPPVGAGPAAVGNHLQKPQPLLFGLVAGLLHGAPDAFPLLQIGLVPPGDPLQQPGLEVIDRGGDPPDERPVVGDEAHRAGVGQQEFLKPEPHA